MDSGLTQQEVAELVKVSEDTLWNWEAGQVTDPKIKTMPAIIDFLGYVPIEVDSDFCELLLAYRAIHGYTQKEAARTVGVDPTTWRNWENGSTSPRNLRRKSIAGQIIKDVRRHAGAPRLRTYLHQLSRLVRHSSKEYGLDLTCI